VRLKDSKRLHLPLFKCEVYCTSSTCSVQFKLHTNEDFQGKVSFEGKMPVKLITICRLRVFVTRTQINSLKRAFISVAASRTKCFIHFNRLFKEDGHPWSFNVLTQWFTIFFVGILFPTNAAFHSTLYLYCRCRSPNPRNVFFSAVKIVTVKIRPFKLFDSLSFVIQWFEVKDSKKISTTPPNSFNVSAFARSPFNRIVQMSPTKIRC